MCVFVCCKFQSIHASFRIEITSFVSQVSEGQNTDARQAGADESWQDCFTESPRRSTEGQKWYDMMWRRLLPRCFIMASSKSIGLGGIMLNLEDSAIGYFVSYLVSFLEFYPWELNRICLSTAVFFKCSGFLFGLLPWNWSQTCWMEEHMPSSGTSKFPMLLVSVLLL